MTAKKLLSTAIAAVLLFGAVFAGVPVAVAAGEQEDLFGFYDGVTFHGGKFIDTAGNVLGTLDEKYTLAHYLNEGLFQIRNNDGNVGFCDTKGNVVFPPNCQSMEYFVGGLSSYSYFYRVNEYGIMAKYGLIDKNGTILTEPIYDSITHLSYDLLIISLDNNYGLMDRGGAVIVPLTYKYIYPVGDNIWSVSADGKKYGLIDRTGKFVLSMEYARIFRGLNDYFVLENETFQQGLADPTGKIVLPVEYDYFEISEELNIMIASKGMMRGLMRFDGTLITPLEYQHMERFYQGLARVRKNNKYGLIDSTGKIIIPIEYDYLQNYGGDMFPVTINEKRGYVNRSGQLIVPPEYDKAEGFYDGLSYVEKKEPPFVGFIDKSGKIVIDLTEQIISGRLTRVDSFLNNTGVTVIRQDTVLGYIQGLMDKSGNIALAMDTYIFHYFSDTCLMVEKNKRYGLFSGGDMILPIEYDYVTKITEDIAAVHKENEYLLFDCIAGKFFQLEVGMHVVGTYYGEQFRDGLAIVFNNHYGFIDNTGKTVIPCQYLEVTPFSDGWATAYDADGNWVILRNPLYIPSSWATSDISTTLALGLVPASLQKGYTQAATRAEFCALAVTLYEKVKGEITTLADFTDTDDINVRKMAGIDVVTGNGDGTFSPEGKITREGSAVLVYKLLVSMGVELPAAAPTFADSGKFSPWAIERVGQVQAASIMSGVGENKFDPQGAFTREMSIITMKKLWDYMGK